MNAIQITGNNPQTDGTWKVSYNATYDDSLHIEGFLYVSQEDMNDMMMRDLPDYVSNIIVNKLGNSAPKVDTVESDSTSASVTVD